VIPPPSRTAAGYRVYDDEDLVRLKFLALARSAGVGLDEVRDVFESWQDDGCARSHQQLQDALATRAGEIESGIDQLTSLRDGLVRAQAYLLSTPPSDSCDADCTCLAAIGLAGDAGQPDIPIACSLGQQQKSDRLSDWHEVMSRATGRSAITHGVRVLLPAEPDLMSRLGELIALELECCSFFEFGLTVKAPAQLVLDAKAPAHAGDSVERLLSVGC
jgi:MerR family transcriptional regulator, copper efflux regulator